MRLLPLLLLTLGLATHANADLFRYTPPALGRIVLNELLTGDARAPLRLPKIGEYYAELILEPLDGASDVALSGPLALEVDFQVARREHVLLNRTITVSFVPGDRSKTLFWLNVPDHLPNRTSLEMHVQLRETSNDQLRNARVRLQLTRKIEFSPFLIR